MDTVAALRCRYLGVACEQCAAGFKQSAGHCIRDTATMLLQQLSIESAAPALDAVPAGAQSVSSLAPAPGPVPALSKAPAALAPAQSPSTAEADTAPAAMQPSTSAQANIALLVGAPATAPDVQSSRQALNAPAAAVMLATGANASAPVPMPAMQPAVAPAALDATNAPDTAVTAAMRAVAPAPVPADSATAAAAIAGSALMPRSIDGVQAGQSGNGSSAAGNATASLAAGFFTESSHVTLIATVTVAAVVGALLLITIGVCWVRHCWNRRRMQRYMTEVVKTGSGVGLMPVVDGTGGSDGGWLTNRTQRSSSPLGLRQAYQPSNAGRQTLCLSACFTYWELDALVLVTADAALVRHILNTHRMQEHAAAVVKHDSDIVLLLMLLHLVVVAIRRKQAGRTQIHPHCDCDRLISQALQVGRPFACLHVSPIGSLMHVT